MTVNQRGRGWQASVQHQGKRLRRNFSTHAEATQWEALAKQSLLLGQPVPQVNSVNINGWTLGDAAERTLRMQWKGKASERTNLVNMRHHLDFFGDKRQLSDITTEAVDDLILHLKDKRLSGATINRVLMNLSRILRTAREYNKMDFAPTIRRQQEGEHRLRWLTDDECDAMIGTAQELGYMNLRDAIIVALDTGVRRSELQRISKDDITKQGLGVWKSKNMVGRVIPLTKRARGILEMRDGNPLFPTNDFIRSPFDRVKYMVGLGDDVVWHTLRHTFASRLVQKGIPIQVVQKLMGHKTIQITMRYAKISDANMDAAISAIDNTSMV